MIEENGLGLLKKGQNWKETWEPKHQARMNPKLFVGMIEQWNPETNSFDVRKNCNNSNPKEIEGTTQELETQVSSIYAKNIKEDH